MSTVEKIQIDLGNLLQESSETWGELIYQDAHFERRSEDKGDDGPLEIKIISDHLTAYEVFCFHISIFCRQTTILNFYISDAELYSASMGHLITKNAEQLYWIPHPPKWRSYDPQGRIACEKTPASWEVARGAENISITLQGDKDGWSEFCVLLFEKDRQSYQNEILQRQRAEQQKVTWALWFSMERITDVWHYFARGQVYNTRYPNYKRSWACQHMGYTLYHYLQYLQSQTGKKIYDVLSSFIAYATMLSLPADGRWKHGVWTEEMETHTVNQVQGINLLLSYYERSGEAVFLEKAEKALRDLLTLSEVLSPEDIWFFHDSLETNQEKAGLFYKPMIISQVFGSSPTNTLCLNTHVYTLLVLGRFLDIHPFAEGERYREQGISSLKKVLEAKPQGVLYSWLYGIRDIIMRLALKTKGRCARKLLKCYEQLLARYILPYMKRKYPRLVMPNGFIERDLTFSYFSNPYYLVNIEVLLSLYGQTGADWLTPILRKAIKQILHSGTVKIMADHDLRATLFLEILFLYGVLVEEKYLQYLPEYISYFEQRGMATPVCMLSNPLMAETSTVISWDNPNIIVLRPVARSGIYALIVNPKDNEEEVCLQLGHKEKNDKFKILDAQGEEVKWQGSIPIAAKSYLKIIAKVRFRTFAC